MTVIWDAGLWLLIVSACIRFGRFVDETLNDNAKQEIAQWLRSADPGGQVSGWANAFSRCFEAAFGSRHVSVRCFFLSALLSFLSAIAWDVLLLRHYGLGLSLIVGDERTWQFFWWMAAVAAVVNVAIDYMSLLETRFAISLLRVQRSRTVIVLVLLGDLLITTIGALFIVFVSMWAISEVDPTTLNYELQPIYYAFALSTFSTSIWAWLFVLAQGVARVGSWIGTGHAWSTRYLDVDNKPGLCVGVLVSVMGTVLYAIVVLIR